MTALTHEDRSQIQRRSVILLSFAQVFSGLGSGAVVSVGSLIASELAGSEAWAGSVTTTMTLGAAFASIPLARLARIRGRRAALSVGLSIALVGTLGMILAAVTGIFALLLIAGALIGVGNAVNLQARFAATDLSVPERRGRDLSIVVWMTTIGSVAGPNLIGASDGVARSLGIPTLSGLFVLAAAGMLIAMVVLWVGLRPDPYLTSLRLTAVTAESDVAAVTTATGEVAKPGGLGAAWRAILASRLALSGLIGIVSAHAVMVAVMSMTPVHLLGHGAVMSIIGLTVSLHIAGMYAFAPVMGWLSDTFGGLPVVLGGLAILLVAVLCAGLSGSDHAITTVGLVLLGVGWSAATVAGSTLIVDNLPREVKLSAQGLSDTSMSLAGALGGALSGVALAFIGYQGLGFVAAGIVVAAALALAVVTVRHRAEAVDASRG